MTHRKELKGQRFGKLLVIEEDGRIGSNVAWICKCDCGNVTRVRANSLLTGNTTSCGCGRIEAITKHNMTNTKLFNVWRTMKERCNNKSYRQYKDYGGRGISLCDEWEEFKPFMEWSLENGYKEGLSIDRIDNDGNYCPENCRWTTVRVQSRNRRANRILEYGGEKHCVAEWSEILGVRANTIFWRLSQGWSTEEALMGRT